MNKIIELINNAETIAILAHESEDGDAVGSSYAMKLMLLGMGKKAECYFSADPEKHLAFMGKNYVLFDANDVPCVDLCICLDTADINRMGERRAIFDNAKHTALIDHHATNEGFAEANFVDSTAPAVGEILFELFLKMDVKITRDIARNLYVSISTDTGSFKYSNVRPRTMEIVAELLKYDIDHAYIARCVFDDEPLSIIQFKGYIMQNIEQYYGEKLNIVTAKKDMLDKFGIEERDTGDIVNIARGVSGCEIAVSVRESGGKIKISFRSNGKYDVSTLAQKFGGGGHKMAAGASDTERTLEEVKAQIIKVCEGIFNG